MLLHPNQWSLQPTLRSTSSLRWLRYGLSTTTRRYQSLVAPATPKSLAAQITELQSQLYEAVAHEEYTMAARLRDQIKELENDDPVSLLNSELVSAIREERYEDAALLQSKLTEVQQASAPGQHLAQVSTKSEAVTDGIRVLVESFYVPDASKPEQQQYLFAYTVTIKNESFQTVKLVERYWEVTNARGQTHEQRGEGVVGRKPELAPGQSFFYQATCPLSSPLGSMQGHYEMYVKSDSSGQWTRSFLAKIDTFALDSTR